MKIIVFGASGSTGKEVVKQALEQGHDVTAFVRRPESFQLQHPHLRIVAGDILDDGAVQKAMSGQEAVISTIGAQPNNKTQIRTRGNTAIVKAMEQTGVRRFITLSGMIAGDSKKLLPFFFRGILIPLILKNIASDHDGQETVVRQSSLDWTIVRAGVLTNKERASRYHHGDLTNEKKLTFKISRADVADFLLKQLSDTTYYQKTLDVTN